MGNGRGYVRRNVDRSTNEPEMGHLDLNRDAQGDKKAGDGRVDQRSSRVRDDLHGRKKVTGAKQRVG